LECTWENPPVLAVFCSTGGQTSQKHGVLLVSEQKNDEGTVKIVKDAIVIHTFIHSPKSFGRFSYQTVMMKDAADAT
jgi:hypothetical protein